MTASLAAANHRSDHLKSRQPTAVHLIAWHVLAAGLLFLAAAARYDAATWTLRAKYLHPILLMVLGYGIGALVPLVLRLLGRSARLLPVILSSFAGFGLAFLALLVIDTAYSRALIFALFAVGSALQVAPFALAAFRDLLVGLLFLGAAAALALNGAYVMGWMPRPFAPKPQFDELYFATAYEDVRARVYTHQLPRPVSGGGGLTALGDQLLLATGDGDLFLVRPPKDEKRLGLKRLPYRVPLNVEEFRADAGPGIRQKRFRVNDVMAQLRGDRLRVVATHQIWFREQKCFSLRVSVLEGTRPDLETADAMTWRTVFQAKPCLRIGGTRGQTFNGNETGGRLWFLDDDRVLVMIGDAAFDGWNSEEQFAQDPEASWGKGLVLHLVDGTVEPFSSGHRNPQGLYVDPDGAIWATEHGPEGGDELNRLRKGQNYGWPLVTYGTQYNSFVWPPSDTPGEHTGFAQPTYAWLPSIGISNVVGIEGDLFERWKGDLIVASLKAQSLFRVRVRENRAVSVETIGKIGERLRDVAESPDGQIALWTDDGRLVFLDPYRGGGNVDLAFSGCIGCHVQEENFVELGPNLVGVFGSDIASLRGFEFSEALRNVPGKWTEENLDAFLADPDGFAPGNAMRVAPVTNAEDRARIIEILRELE